MNVDPDTGLVIMSRWFKTFASTGETVEQQIAQGEVGFHVRLVCGEAKTEWVDEDTPHLAIRSLLTGEWYIIIGNDNSNDAVQPSGEVFRLSRS